MTYEDAILRAEELDNGKESLWVQEGYRRFSQLLGCARQPSFAVFINGTLGEGESYSDAFEDWEERYGFAVKQKKARLVEQLADLEMTA